MKIAPVILCGGSGTRLWPISRESHPKQFVNLGNGRTLFKDTLARIKNFPEACELVAVCNEDHRFFVSEEMREAGLEGKIILEPAPRNTAPAIALAAGYLQNQPDCLMLVMPADHYLEDGEAFAKTVIAAAPLALDNKIVAFGAPPTYPATGYGYIKTGRPRGETFEIIEFIEKPDQDRARAIMSEGGCFWNAGIFLLRPGLYLSELKKYSPGIAEACARAMYEAERKNNYIRPHRGLFLESPSDSIDYAIMEKTSSAVMAPLNVKWSDLGSWEAFFQQADKDAANNAIQGDVLIDGAHDCYLYSSGRLITAVDVSNLMVVETPDAVVVARRQEGQKIKDIVNKIKNSGRRHYKQPALIHKPWGSYEILASGDRFQVKRLIVNPEGKLSLQYHYHRAEHWIIVSGAALIELDGRENLYTENHSVYIPIGCRHRLQNPGKIPLILIEVQSGAYLEENDIVRVEDKYERNDK